ncbi:hypothetical protein ACLKA7_014583 [Drosophila subpalustris]
MPNNRNRNRNRNRNKRNKNQNANQNKQPTTEEEKPAEQEEAATSSSSSATTTTTTLKAADDHHNDNNANSGNISNGSSAASDSCLTVADAAPAGIAITSDNIDNSNTASVNQPRDLAEDQPVSQPKNTLVQSIETSADCTKEQLEYRGEQQTTDHAEDQLAEQPKQPENQLKEPSKDQSVDQLKDKSAHLTKDQLTHSEDQLPKQPKEPVLVEKEASLLSQLQDQSKAHSEDQSEQQPTVHIVPVIVEKSEEAKDQLIVQPKNHLTDQSVDQPTVHIVPVFVQKDENCINRSEDQSIDQSENQPKDKPKAAVRLIPITLEKQEIGLREVQQRESNAMGAKNSKQQQSELPQEQQQQQQQPELPQQPQQKAPGSPRQAKVIVHRLVREEGDQIDGQQQQHVVAPSQQQQAPNQPLQRSTKVIIHQIRVETDAEERARRGKPTIEEISSTTTTAATTHCNSNNSNNSGTLSPPPRYLVESPSPKNVSSVVQFGKFARDVQIQELELNSDCSSGEFNCNGMQSPVVCEVDSETEATTPVAAKAFSPELPSSSRAEQQEQLRQKRAQKRNALESHFLPQLLSPRYLDSILEENSEAAAGSDHNQAVSRSSSAASNDPAKTRPVVPPKANESFPRSQLDFSRRHKRREEPVALMLETKLLDQPSDLESCTRLQSTLSPQSEDAELVYLSSSASSSVSDLMELELEQAAALAERALIDLDTDASKLINRPDPEERSSSTTTEPVSSSNETETEGECEVETEVDTETETEATVQSSRESTPVNAHPPNEAASPSSSLSSLLSAATPTATATPAATPTATPTPAEAPPTRETTLDEVPPLTLAMLANEFGSNKLANSRSAAPSLSVTREEFVRNMEKVRELIEMTRREENAIDNVNANGNGNENRNELRCRLTPSPSPPPPPVPPPPSSMHYPNHTTTELHPTQSLSLLKRQESNDSHCSDSTQHSQCTAIHVASPPPPAPPAPPTPPLRQQQPQQHNFQFSGETDAESIKKLRLLCTETLASMPYGEQMLEELATVAQNITEQQQQQQQQQQQHASNMPYPLPHLPHIGELQLSLGAKAREDAWLGLPTQADPKLLVCLSPGQRALVEQQSQQQQQQQQQPDQLLDAHEKFVQRRGYHELTVEQVRALDSEQLKLKLEQEQMLKTAAKMRELRKSLTPTSPPPTAAEATATTAATTAPAPQQLSSPVPPPVPVKSAETAAKAKSQAKADDARERGNSNYQKVITSTATSSFENKPRQAAAATAADPQQQSSEQLPYSFGQQQQQQQHSSYTSNNSSHMSSNKSKFPASMESELARMFPSIAQQGDIFDEQRKRYSNIEQSSQQKEVQSKRYSNIETSSFESRKRTENGQVVYDYSNSSREQQEEFPLKQPDETQPKVHHINVRKAVEDEDEVEVNVDVDDCAPPVPPPPATNIMSATKLNGKANTFIDDAQQQQQQQHITESSNSSNNREEQQQINSTVASAKVNNVGSTYEEFRQRAKAAIEALGQPNNSSNSIIGGSNNISQPLDNEKLFKDFDALSQQLNAELQTSRDRREQRDKSASLYDLSRHGQQQLEQLKRQRHAHMQELEQEIERSAKSRQERLASVPRSTEIPDYAARSRRAESLCNLSAAEQDDWSRYASDLGYSENIARPFAREVEICYQRQRQPHAIRAPRLSVSTNDLSSSSYDSCNAYGGARRHAPMLPQAPQQQQRPHYASCYSMIERDPNPTYISTTSRRGVSPAPPLQPPAYDRQQRRASLPRELHEQQLQYILSKEEQLKLEFERLQQERRRLMDEMQRAPTVLQAPPPRRESYRPAPKLPTLSEDEVFRQQMAEEWMHKVAEREERRQHKIIKISKIEDEQPHATEEQANISDEFLHRVKQRRHKLAMPADSDWESGAESQPMQQPKAAGSESDAEAPPMRVLEGQAEANLRELPRHLREFAKFSTCEQLDGGQGQVERHEEQERSEMATDNSHCSASKKSTIVKTYKVSRLPPSVQGESLVAANRYRYRYRSNTAKLVSHNVQLGNASVTSSQSPDTGCGSASKGSSSPSHSHSSSPSTVQTDSNNNTTDSSSSIINSSTAGSILSTALLLGLSVLTAWQKLS